MKEAQSLNLRQQFGGGNRWRSLLVMFGILGGLLVLFYFRIRDEVPVKYQPLVLAAVAALFLFFYFQQNRSRKKPAKPPRFEITSQGVTVINGEIRVEQRWSGFAQCLESPNLFVLLDQAKRYLLVFPKRAFPDAAAVDWFRAQANQPVSVAASTADVPFSPVASPPANGVVLNFSHGYRDYLSRTVMSWRTRGIFALVYGTMIFTWAYQTWHPSPTAVVSPTNVFLIITGIFTLMLVFLTLFIAWQSWRTDAKYLSPRQVVLTDECLFGTGKDCDSRLPWTTYKYYLENTRCFLVWNSRGQAWDMFPKRAFSSAADIERCRELLQRHLKKSRWFFI